MLDQQDCSTSNVSQRKKLHQVDKLTELRLHNVLRMQKNPKPPELEGLGQQPGLASPLQGWGNFAHLSLHLQGNLGCSAQLYRRMRSTLAKLLTVSSLASVLRCVTPADEFKALRLCRTSAAPSACASRT